MPANGCSGFFKRSVRRRLIYRRVLEHAPGIRLTGTKCQACRLKRCLQAGMNKDAVQHERQPSKHGAAVAPRSPHTNTTTNTTWLQHTLQQAATAAPGNHHHPHRLMRRKPIDVMTEEPEGKQAQVGCRLYPLPGPESVYEMVSAPPLHVGEMGQKPTCVSHLPFRDQTFPTYIHAGFQVILLEEAWSEMFLLSAIQWSLPMDKCPLLCLPERSPSEHPKAGRPTADLHCLRDVFDRFKSLAVDPTEFACLKAIVLFKPETRGLKDPDQVENLQDQSQVLLGQHIHTLHPSQSARFGRLLLLLPAFRFVSPEKIEQMFFHGTIGDTPMEKLLCDMFKN
ncbi:hypothetical protein CRUP_018648 [Coryphaenoides rupestris]|nr:hypothetical protein CRUP_018648 [Coryphaenoides rupestris]